MRVMVWHPTTSGISTAPSVCQEGRDRGGREERERGRKEGGRNGREKGERKEGREEERREERKEREKRGDRMITQHVYKGVDLQLRTPPSSLSQNL